VRRTALLWMLLSLALPGAARAEDAWEPSKPVELLVAAGSGGASDQMARLVQSAIVKHGLMRQPLVVQIRGGASGGEALIEAQASPADPHKLLLAISNIYTLPLGVGLPFRWTDVTPVAMLALDPFVLWVNAAKPYQNPQQFLDAVKAAEPQSFKVGGTGSRREDQILSSAIERSAGVRFAYVPYKSGGEVSTQLAGEHIDACVNNPSESIAQWRAGQLRPLCVLAGERMAQREPVADGRSWADLQTCKELGLDVQYTMLRGFLLPAGVTPEQRAFYTELLRRVSETPEWKEYAARNALLDRFVSGAQFEQFLREDEQRHQELMGAAGLLKQ
jgi:putative tricarboxylic transport membrane protein